MIFSKSRKEALELLKGGVWHTTSKKRFDGIIADGFIRVSPNIPNASRWKTSGGPDCYPFVRKLGGISLFDFRDFDEVEYSSRCPMSSWHEFVPVCSGWESSI